MSVVTFFPVNNGQERPATEAEKAAVLQLDQEVAVATEAILSLLDTCARPTRPLKLERNMNIPLASGDLVAPDAKKEHVYFAGGTGIFVVTNPEEADYKSPELPAERSLALTRHGAQVSERVTTASLTAHAAFVLGAKVLGTLNSLETLRRPTLDVPRWLRATVDGIKFAPSKDDPNRIVVINDGDSKYSVWLSDPKKVEVEEKAVDNQNAPATVVVETVAVETEVPTTLSEISSALGEVVSSDSEEEEEEEEEVAPPEPLPLETVFADVRATPANVTFESRSGRLIFRRKVVSAGTFSVVSVAETEVHAARREAQSGVSVLEVVPSLDMSLYPNAVFLIDTATDDLTQIVGNHSRAISERFVAARAVREQLRKLPDPLSGVHMMAGEDIAALPAGRAGQAIKCGIHAKTEALDDPSFQTTLVLVPVASKEHALGAVILEARFVAALAAAVIENKKTVVVGVDGSGFEDDEVHAAVSKAMALFRNKELRVVAVRCPKLTEGEVANVEK